jgi:hypothetical protein
MIDGENKISPDYYNRYKTQPIDFISEAVGPGFIVGNVIKYVLRYDKKNGVEDVKKALRYCEFLINMLENRKPSEDK